MLNYLTRDFFVNPILHAVISVWFNLVCGIPDKTINIHSFLHYFEPGKSVALFFPLGYNRFRKVLL